jgi:hypothetical protein
VTIAAVLIIFLVGYSLLRTSIRRYKLSRLDWDQLLAKVEPVSIDEISIVALDYLQPKKGQLALRLNEIWLMIRQTDGPDRMYANAAVLLALAGYAERWNFEESIVVAARMRQDAITLRRATLKLSISVWTGANDLMAPFYFQEAASAYYLMRQRLLALYETSHVGRYPSLAARI